MKKILLALVASQFLSGCFDPVEKANELLQASQGDLQAKRALTLSEEALPDLDRVDVLFSVSAAQLEAVTPRLLATLSASETAQANGIVFDEANFVFRDQAILADIGFSAIQGDVVVRGRAQASAYIGATAKALHWNLYLDGLRVTDIENLPWYALSVPDAANALLNSSMAIMNTILDEAVNGDPQKALLVELSKPDLISQDLRDSSNDDFIFEERRLDAGLATRSSAVLVTEKGITVAAKVDFIPPDQVDTTPPVFPEDANLVRQSIDGWTERAALYQATVRERIAASMGEENAASLTDVETGFAVTKEALARLLNFLFDQGPVTGVALFNEASSSSSPLTFDIEQRDCRKYNAGCDYKHFCEGDRCLKEVDEVFDKACKVNCCLQSGFLGCIIPGLCDGVCKETRRVTRPIASASCDGFRATNKVYGGALCDIASNVDRAICDIDANLRKSMCDVEQEIGRFYKANPVATVTASVRPNARAELKVSGAEMAADLNQFSADFRASGSGSIDAAIRYDRHNYADIAAIPAALSLGTACAVDWAESVSVETTIDPFEDTLNFDVTTAEGEEDSLSLTFSLSEPKTLFADFDPPPLAALFVGKPQVTLNCPLASISSIGIGTAEAVFTRENARTVLPLLTGKRFPQNFEKGDIKFEIELEPLELCLPNETVSEVDKEDKGDCEEPLLTLAPEATDMTIRYLSNSG